MVGDICGEKALEFFCEKLPSIVSKHQIDAVIVNGENIAGGFGILENHVKALLDCGVDVITGGNHSFEKRDIYPVLQATSNLLRPANYPDSFVDLTQNNFFVPGKGWCVIEKDDFSFAVINLQGREFMTNLDCPFRWMDSFFLNETLSKKMPILLDFHAESNQEKEALGLYLDGRISCICGTHTHVQTSDAKILPKGTAYLTDLGFTGPSKSVIGSKPEQSIERNSSQVLVKLECADSPFEIDCAIITVNKESCLSTSINTLRTR